MVSHKPIGLGRAEFLIPDDRLIRAGAMDISPEHLVRAIILCNQLRPVIAKLGDIAIIRLLIFERAAHIIIT